MYNIESTTITEIHKHIQKSIQTNNEKKAYKQVK